MTYVDPREFADLGYLQEVNRLLLHPLGMALEVRFAADGAHLAVQDHRDDPAGVVFDPEMDLKSKAEEVLQRFSEHLVPRVQAHGFIIQPITADEDGCDLCIGCGQPLFEGEKPQ